jgi:hypothetical protein
MMAGIGLSAVQDHMKQRLPLAPGMEISYVIRDAYKWEIDKEKAASESMLSTMEGYWRRLNA